MLQRIKAKNDDLQALRGIAAITVFISHLIAHLPRVDRKYLHLISFFSNWGTEAVMIFFILSGLVIHISYEKNHSSKFEFIKNRIMRIHPTLIIAAILAAVFNLLLFKVPFSTIQFIANIIPVTTLSGYIAPPYWDTNPVIWTLTFEVFFYLTFAVFCIGKNHIKLAAVWIWFLLSLTSIFLRITFSFGSDIINHVLLVLSFSCIWIVGFMIWQYRGAFYSSFYLAVFCAFSLPLISRLHILPYYHDPLRYLLFAVASWPFFQYLADRKTDLGFPSTNKVVFVIVITIFLFSSYWIWLDPGYLIWVKVLYIAFPIAMTAGSYFFRTSTTTLYDTFLPILSYLGSISYSVYLFHFPIIILVTTLFKIHPLIQILIILPVVGVMSHYMEFWLQPRIKRLFQS